MKKNKTNEVLPTLEKVFNMLNGNYGIVIKDDKAYFYDVFDMDDKHPTGEAILACFPKDDLLKEDFGTKLFSLVSKDDIRGYFTEHLCYEMNVPWDVFSWSDDCSSWSKILRDEGYISEADVMEPYCRWVSEGKIIPLTPEDIVKLQANKRKTKVINDYNSAITATIVVTQKIPTRIKITKATLLSVEEYEACKNIIPNIGDWWWLRSAGGYSGLPAYVYNGYYGNIVEYVSIRYGIQDPGGAVRPALFFKTQSNSLLTKGDKVAVAGLTFTVISDNMMLCDSAIGNCAFRKNYMAKDASVYEVSDIKKYVAEWFNKTFKEDNK